ncbi:MAG: Hsp20/alpha crystallin family protein [Acidobacteria bacterium]|nr:Hsp20/alpha crystallin family protein [Acidobacteriota bacterium]MBI3263781.1 Hsp20/alpha crystallin family protein [Acidobacteriota bacterium]
MPSLIDTLSPALDARDLADETRRLFDELAAASRQASPLASECRPPIDVVESEHDFEIVMDVPGVPIDQLRILLTRSTLLVAGQKLPPDSGERADASFHLVERGFGRFARAVRLTGAIDGGRVRASLKAGELRILVPKRQERRGRQFLVPVREE